MWQCGVGRQTFVVGDVQNINTIREDIFFNSIKFVSDGNCFEFTFQFGCQRSAFSQQFHAHLGNLTVFYFAINKNTIHNLGMFYQLTYGMILN